jgi:hypothetical protein
VRVARKPGGVRATKKDALAQLPNSTGAGYLLKRKCVGWNGVRGKVLICSSNATADERVFRDVYLAVHFSNKALHLFKQHALLKRLMSERERKAGPRVPALRANIRM